MQTSEDDMSHETDFDSVTLDDIPADERLGEIARQLALLADQARLLAQTPLEGEAEG
jgi:hypothetical protein